MKLSQITIFCLGLLVLTVVYIEGGSNNNNNNNNNDNNGKDRNKGNNGKGNYDRDTGKCKNFLKTNSFKGKKAVCRQECALDENDCKCICDIPIPCDSCRAPTTTPALPTTPTRTPCTSLTPDALINEVATYSTGLSRSFEIVAIYTNSLDDKYAIEVFDIHGNSIDKRPISNFVQSGVMGYATVDFEYDSVLEYATFALLNQDTGEYYQSLYYHFLATQPSVINVLWERLNSISNRAYSYEGTGCSLSDFRRVLTDTFTLGEINADQYFEQ